MANGTSSINHSSLNGAVVTQVLRGKIYVIRRNTEPAALLSPIPQDEEEMRAELGRLEEVMRSLLATVQKGGGGIGKF